MHPINISDNAWIGITVTMHTLAIAMGSFRLIHRYRTKLYYWDDWGAAGCLICTVTVFSVLCTLKGGFPKEDPTESERPQYWLLWFCLASAQWTSRLSIAFTVLRLILFDIWRKWLTLALIIAVTLAWMLIILDYIIECHVNTLPHPNCTREIVPIVSFSMYIIGDMGLVYIPLHLLKSLRLPRGSRFMVRLVFSAAGISTVGATANLISEIYEGSQKKTMGQLTCILKAPTALISCSLVVIIPCVYRLFRSEEEWMVSIPINIDVSHLGPADVSLPERVVVRNPAIRSFPTLLLPFSHRSYTEQRELHSWPLKEDKLAC